MNKQFGYKSLVENPKSANRKPSRGRLKAMLLTTFDAVDEDFLVEVLLPGWAGISHRLGDGDELAVPFQIELGNALRDAAPLVVVCSPPRNRGLGEPLGTMYPWLLRHLRPAFVGARGQVGRVTQHAKLWLFHRAPLSRNPNETLEICVSSANLTRSAFSDQIQAAWRCEVPLEDRGSRRRLGSWGILPAFIEALAEECGKQSNADIRSFATLLERATCPRGVGFVASVPGNHTQDQLCKTPWGLAGLERINNGHKASAVKIVVPFVGDWQEADLRSWCKSADCDAAPLTVGWIPDNPRLPPTLREHWVMPRQFADNAKGLGIDIRRLESIRIGGREEVKLLYSEEKRWLHAKLYEFEFRSRSHRLLLTSANFSVSAWGTWTGKGMGRRLHIQNYELGVLLDGIPLPLGLCGMIPPHCVHTKDAPVLDDAAVRLPWAEAEWDGKVISVNCRTNPCDSRPVIGGLCTHRRDGSVETQKPRSEFSRQDGHGPWTARLKWRETMGTPVAVELTCGTDSACSVPVYDSRPLGEKSLTAQPIVGAAEDEVVDCQDKILFERYGGRCVEDSAEEQHAMPTDLETNSGPPKADYMLEYFRKAREWFAVVDSWWGQAKSAGESDRACLERDGDALLHTFQRYKNEYRQSTGDQLAAMGKQIAAEIVAEEIKRRINELGNQ